MVSTSRGFLGIRVLRPPLPLEVLTTEGHPPNRHSSDSKTPSAEPEPPPGDIPEGSSERPIQIKPLAREEEAKRLRIEGRVRLAPGPWELEEGWWQENAAGRDYWDVELEGGGLYRLYRDRGTGDWFADGIYD